MTIRGLVIPLCCVKCGGDVTFVENVEDPATASFVQRSGVQCSNCLARYCVTVTMRGVNVGRGWRPTYDHEASA